MKKESIKKIQTFISEIKHNEKIDNAVIRDDVFSILEKKCTVLYFPLKDDDIDGFHIERTINGQKKDFVFINSAKKTEKQISQSHTLYIILYTTHRPFRVNIMHKVKLYSPISHPYIF